jgi:hypothetical protein
MIYEAVTVPVSMPGSGHHSITSAPSVPWLPARLWANLYVRYAYTHTCHPL